MAELKLIQLNIERDKHLDLIIPFLRAEKPDIVCMQELADHSVKTFETELGMHAHFTPMNKRSDEGIPHIQGVAIFSSIPFSKTWSERYAGAVSELSEYNGATPASKHETQRFELCFAEVVTENSLFRFATTHFPWTADGSASEFQRDDMSALIEILSHQDGVVLTGDFNAPRGGEIFATLAAAYKDNVPLEYTTSIDGSLHRAGALPYMVDGIFSSPNYIVSNVVMKSGVSDHCALVATIHI